MKYKLIKLLLQSFYNCIKFFYHPKNKVGLLSRQGNELWFDMVLLKEELNAHGILTEVSTCKLSKKNLFKYVFVLLKQMKILASCKVVVIDSYIIPVSLLKHRPETKIIQMWHALGAIKQFGYQTLNKPAGSSSDVANGMAMHHNYDYILAANQTSKEKFMLGFNQTSDKFIDIALCHVDYLTKGISKIDRKFDKQVVLYAPTFRKGQKIEILDELIENFDFKKYELVVKLHPLDKTEVNDQRIIVDKINSTYDWLIKADIIVTDYSALIFDVCAINKPLHLLCYDIERYQESCGLNYDLEAIFKQYYHQDVKSLISNLDKKYTKVTNLFDIDMNRNYTESLVTFIESLL